MKKIKRQEKEKLWDPEGFTTSEDTGESKVHKTKRLGSYKVASERGVAGGWGKDFYEPFLSQTS